LSLLGKVLCLFCNAEREKGVREKSKKQFWSKKALQSAVCLAFKVSVLFLVKESSMKCHVSAIQSFHFVFGQRKVCEMRFLYHSKYPFFSSFHVCGFCSSHCLSPSIKILVFMHLIEGTKVTVFRSWIAKENRVC